MQAGLVFFRVCFVANVLAQLVIGMMLFIVIIANAEKSLLVKNKSGMKTAAILFVRL
jgi:hypothetical protein